MRLRSTAASSPACTVVLPAGKGPALAVRPSGKASQERIACRKGGGRTAVGLGGRRRCANQQNTCRCVCVHTCLLEGHVRGWARRGWGQGEGRGKRGGGGRGKVKRIRRHLAPFCWCSCRASRPALAAPGCFMCTASEHTAWGRHRMMPGHAFRFPHTTVASRIFQQFCTRSGTAYGSNIHGHATPCFVRNSSRGAAWSPIRRGLCTTSWMMAQEEVRSQRSGRAPAGCSHRSARRPLGQISGPAPPQGRPAPDAPAGPPSPFQLASLPAPIGTRLPFSRTDGAHISHMRSSDHRTECSYPFQ